MLRKNQEYAAHRSAEATILDKPIAEVRAQVRELSKFLMFISSCQPSAETVVLPGEEHNDLRGMLDLRDTVATLFGMPKDTFGIRLSVTTNEEAHNRYRSEQRGHPINNLHTDFRMRKTKQGRELFLPKASRITAVFGGDGTSTVHGDVEARRAQTFVAESAGGSNFEHLMEDLKPVLLGADGQIIRGPASNRRQYRLSGDFERVELPEGVWGELHPTTLHETAEYLHKGRAVLNIDQVESVSVQA